VQKLTSVERAKLDTFVQGDNSSVTQKISLSENQEDKLALLRTLQVSYILLGMSHLLIY
jgi:hypothetical protein